MSNYFTFIICNFSNNFRFILSINIRFMNEKYHLVGTILRNSKSNFSVRVVLSS